MLKSFNGIGFPSNYHNNYNNCKSNENFGIKHNADSYAFANDGRPYSQICSTNSNIQGHKFQDPSFDDKFITNENNSVASNSMQNEYYNSDSDNLFINEIKLIPRNRISAFKAFRNLTFKLVPTGTSNQALMNNSNNSNRFCNGKYKGFNGSNSSTTLSDSYISKMNKKIMLKKITELANPYHSTDSGNLKQFKRVIPHPIIDDKIYRDIANKTFLMDPTDSSPNNNFKIDEDNYDCSEIIIEEDIVKTGGVGTISQFSFKDSIDIINYENILKKKLIEIQNFKKIPKLQNEEDSCMNISETNSVIVYCSNNSPKIEGIVNNSNSIRDNVDNESSFKTRQRTNSSGGLYFNKYSNQNNISERTVKTDQPLPIHKYQSSKLISMTPANKQSFPDLSMVHGNLYQGDQLTHKSDSSKKANKCRKLNMNNKMLVSEIEVCLDEHNPSKTTVDNFYIPLFFQCVGGKKLKFKLRFLSRIVQAQKAFCNRMGIGSLSELRFLTESGRIISDADTPNSLHLKAHDIIIVINSQQE